MKSIQTVKGRVAIDSLGLILPHEHMFTDLRQRAELWCKKYRFCSELGLYELFSCEWCNSIWIGAVLTMLYLWLGEAVLYLALPLALSTVAIIIKYVVQVLQSAEQYFSDHKSHQQ